MTDRMQQVFTLMGIGIVDHIIIGDNDNYYSFREHQEMPVGQPHYSAELAEIRLKEQFPLRPEPTSVLDQLKEAKEMKSLPAKAIRNQNSRADPGR